MHVSIFGPMHNYLSFTLNTVQISTWSRKSQLSAHNTGIIGIPSIITNCPPHSIDADLHSACTLQRSINQTHSSISATLGSCVYNVCDTKLEENMTLIECGVTSQIYCLLVGITATRRSSTAKDPKSVFILPALVVPIAKLFINTEWNTHIKLH